MAKKRLTEMSVDQPQTSQSMDLWIGISVSVKIIRRGSAVAFGDKAFGYRCTKDIWRSSFSSSRIWQDRISTSAIEYGVFGIASTLVDNQAKWHKHCRNRFSELKLDREISKSQKRKSSDIYTSSDTKKATRQSSIQIIYLRKLFFLWIKLWRNSLSFYHEFS